MKSVWLGTITLFCFVGCSDGQGETSSKHASHEGTVQEIVVSREVLKPVPDEFKAGEERFNDLCARCHGMAGRGTNMGPPLVHKIYEPSHHADFAFMRARPCRASGLTTGNSETCPKFPKPRLTTLRRSSPTSGGYNDRRAFIEEHAKVIIRGACRPGGYRFGRPLLWHGFW